MSRGLRLGCGFIVLVLGCVGALDPAKPVPVLSPPPAPPFPYVPSRVPPPSPYPRSLPKGFHAETPSTNRRFSYLMAVWTNDTCKYVVPDGHGGFKTDALGAGTTNVYRIKYDVLAEPAESGNFSSVHLANAIPTGPSNLVPVNGSTQLGVGQEERAFELVPDWKWGTKFYVFDRNSGKVWTHRVADGCGGRITLESRVRPWLDHSVNQRFSFETVFPDDY